MALNLGICSAVYLPRDATCNVHRPRMMRRCDTAVALRWCNVHHDVGHDAHRRLRRVDVPAAAEAGGGGAGARVRTVRQRATSEATHRARRRAGSRREPRVFRTMNSLRMSFWMVPASLSGVTPCSSAATMYIARMGSTAPFIVIETDTLSSGIPSNSVFMSSTESMATPAIPTSPCTRGLSESYPRCVARSNATETPCWPAAMLAR